MLLSKNKFNQQINTDDYILNADFPQVGKTDRMGL